MPTAKKSPAREVARKFVRAAARRIRVLSFANAVILPFLTGLGRRTYAAIFSFIAGVMPPMPMFGRSLL